MNANTELNALSLNILFDGYVQLLEIQRVKDDHFHGRKNSVLSYFMCTCSDRLNTQFYFDFVQLPASSLTNRYPCKHTRMCTIFLYLIRIDVKSLEDLFDTEQV